MIVDDTSLTVRGLPVLRWEGRITRILPRHRTTDQMYKTKKAGPERTLMMFPLLRLDPGINWIGVLKSDVERCGSERFGKTGNPLPNHEQRATLAEPGTVPLLMMSACEAYRCDVVHPI